MGCMEAQWPEAERDRARRAAQPAEGVAADLPLDYMLAVVRDPSTAPDRRDKLAIAAAPYVHPKLAASVVVQGEATQEQLAALLADMRAAQARMVKSVAVPAIEPSAQAIDIVDESEGL